MTESQAESDDGYRHSAEVVYTQLIEYAEFARRLQAEYGKWLITTLYVVHAGAIAGLIFKGPAGAPPYIHAVWAFVAGLVLALAAGFCAWLNFSLVEASKLKMADHRMLRNRKYWPEGQVPYWSGIKWSLGSAIGCGAASLICIPVGAAIVAFLWN